jgi:hypothetical protein
MGWRRLFSLVLMLATPTVAFGQRPGAFGTHMSLMITDGTRDSVREAGGPLISQASTTNTLVLDRFQARTSSSVDGVGPSLKAHATVSGGAVAQLVYEFWDSARISGTCPLSADPSDLAPCIEFRWKVEGKLSAFGTGGNIGSATINFNAPYVNNGFDPPGGQASSIQGQAFQEGTGSYASCDGDNICMAENHVSRSGSFVLSAADVNPGTFRAGSTVGWGVVVQGSTNSGVSPGSPWDGNGEAAFDGLKRGVTLVILSRYPDTTISSSASAVASGKAWKQDFGRWDVVHCPPFAPDVPASEFTVAYIPVRYQGGSSHLTVEQIQDRTEYITDYYYQQSMCSVLITRGW